MLYITDDLGALLKSSNASEPILATDPVSAKDVRKLLRLQKEMNNIVLWEAYWLQNGITTDQGAKRISKILKCEAYPAEDLKVKLVKGDLIICLTLHRKKPEFDLVKVIGV